MERKGRKTWSLLTQLQHTAMEEAEAARAGPAVSAPIFQTSTWRLRTPEEGARLSTDVHPAAYYTRYGSPNVRGVEALVAEAEGAEAALAVGSGMAAISTALSAFTRAGDHVVAQTAHYTGALTLLSDWLPRAGVTVTQVNQTDTAAFAAAMRPNTRLVYVETPTNPTLALTDLAAVAELAKARGALCICDNTFASSLNQRPLSLGVDLVVHSATKYFGGHSDVTAGLLAGRKALIDEAWEHARVHGPVLHPFEAWLLARGMKTYPLRLAAQNAGALALAQALEAHPAVARVHYPGLPSHPQHALARKQMTGGFGGMLSFTVAGSDEQAYGRALAVLEHVELCIPAVSLGGTETLLVHPASLIFGHQPPEQLSRAGVAPGLLRLSVGIESPEDLLADLTQALTRAAAA
ncbi:aminotransferase class I/II-fold pyridoxal phosphate-dependent enzyme [Aggregicoccus sp. 17bor-14]|uniref:trans-sulfuration enzyme family protein n=1 Tax=Myxococcaceae TaxID=31 RepID=UPI00129C5DAB|nr:MULTISPECIES: aminotransferase class I/II-fold pyridoxal phosphate-dependent enzyme [Myxococcaceae]MBF5041612.1 aminotransferase class I/II-fold pyridoxal phosphate-dependent enzyme [Simulacricoccus sp. 17bor-14]MRI87397.1 aminotransferase class I/II-fold pyridoxal phosphate-dependent enzyme [Aggregicoccus sp. 17bor-14]